MKTVVTSLLLALLAGAATAHQAPANRAYVLYQGRLIPLDSLKPAAARRAKPGHYRAAPHTLRVQVPAPHPDSVAVASPGRSADRMPRQPLPMVRLLPEGQSGKVQ